VPNTSIADGGLRSIVIGAFPSSVKFAPNLFLAKTISRQVYLGQVCLGQVCF
jgi:hypothetical protein